MKRRGLCCLQMAGDHKEVAPSLMLHVYVLGAPLNDTEALREQSEGLDDRRCPSLTVHMPRRVEKILR